MQIRLILLHKGLCLLIFRLQLSVTICLLFKIFCQDNKIFYFKCFSPFPTSVFPETFHNFSKFRCDLNSLPSKVFHEGNFEENFIFSCGLLLAWFNLLEINSISVIIYLYSQNDICSLKLWRQYQPRTQLPRKMKKNAACNFPTMAMSSFVISHDLICQMENYAYMQT